VRRRESREEFRAERRGERTADPTPKLRGRERTQRILEARRPEWERQRIEAERSKVGTTAAAFLADTLEGVRAFRYHELRERWMARGGKGEDLRRAATRTPFRLTRETDERSTSTRPTPRCRSAKSSLPWRCFAATQRRAMTPLLWILRTPAETGGIVPWPVRALGAPRPNPATRRLAGAVEARGSRGL
jgi:hypothetical protein